MARKRPAKYGDITTGTWAEPVDSGTTEAPYDTPVATEPILPYTEKTDDELHQAALEEINRRYPRAVVAEIDVLRGILTELIMARLSRPNRS